MQYETSQKLLGLVTISKEIFGQMKEEVKHISDFKKKVEEFSNQKVTDLVDVILSGSIIITCSDIHIEPQEDQARLRVRLDGVLQDVLFFDLKIYRTLLSRLKLLSKIKLNITGKPQDGRFTILIDETPIEIRASSLPSEYGESIVMRILNPKNLIGLEALGLRKDLLEIFGKEIKKPNGMIIVTGPTGSGKTTTLYAFLMKIQNPEIKIITIEDPIEYHLKGISQTQVAPEKGYDFGQGLRSIVRQDPDVILVGEIRDLETAKIALQASLTGHLVLSTLHTNDAAGTIPRLVDLGTEPSSIAPALNMAVAQRLVRRVCSKCATLVKPTPKQFDEIKKGLENLPKTVKIAPLDKNLKIPKIKGCEFCNNTGYRGRRGLFEAFLIDDEMEKFILTNPPVSSIRELAIKKGMVTMYQSGLIEVVEGKTTMEEILRMVEAN
ncbi:GspE/PulE family protein [Patescibacteria group bacterium]|nr:GspE/PulE family protein [Patescibacteria group bacterium]MBU4367520.1 GspE/PulE family protein [Patescibacteria group bacterium]MBU4461561.1 GspE/PulE family protein [Patescibacteria group bacterium]MCG2699458.1 GspE/PulE family protein [Candidatus Parcubacteria bacterium]